MSHRKGNRMVRRTGFRLQDSGLRVPAWAFILLLPGVVILLLSSNWRLSPAFAQMPTGAPIYNVNAKWVTDRGSQVFNVKGYGAYGDGVHDDTAAIQALIHQLDGYGSPAASYRMYFPSGVYLISSPLVYFGSQGAWLRFEGETGGGIYTTGAVLKWNSSAQQPMMIWMGANGAELDHIDFNANGAARFGLLIAAANTTNTTLGTAVTPGTRTVTPASMSNIVVGRYLPVDTGSNAEVVYVSAVTATTFTATFVNNHTSSAPVGLHAAGGGASYSMVVQNVSVYGIPLPTPAPASGQVGSFASAPTNGGAGGVAAVGDRLQLACGAYANVATVSSGNVATVFTTPEPNNTGSGCVSGAGQAATDGTHPSETGITLNVASVTSDCQLGNATCTAGFAAGNVTSGPDDEVATVTFRDDNLTGSGNAGIVILEPGNTCQFQADNVQARGFRYGWVSDGDGEVELYHSGMGGTLADISTGSENTTVVGWFTQYTPMFVTGGAGQLTILESTWAGTTLSNGLGIAYNGPLTLIGNFFENNLSSTSVVHVQVGTPLFPPSYGAAGITLTGNMFFNLAQGSYPPLYDGNFNTILPTYYGNQPVAVWASNNYGFSGGSNVRLADYSAVGILTDESQSQVATTGVLRGGDTSALLGWRNHAGNGDITLSKDSSDVIRFGGAIGLGTGTAINALNLYSTASITPTAVGAASCSDQTFSVTWLLATDRVSNVTPPAALGNLSLNGYASASGTVLFHFCNSSSSSVTPPAGVYSFLAVH